MQCLQIMPSSTLLLAPTPGGSHLPHILPTSCLIFPSKYFPLLSGLFQREMLFPVMIWDDLRNSSNKYFPCDGFVGFLNNYMTLTSHLRFPEGLV